MPDQADDLGVEITVRLGSHQSEPGNQRCAVIHVPGTMADAERIADVLRATKVIDVKVYPVGTEMPESLTMKASEVAADMNLSVMLKRN